MQSTTPSAPGRWRSRKLATTVAATALLLGACIEDFSAPDPQGPVDNVLVSTIPLNESMVTIRREGAIQLTAAVTDQGGTPRTNRAVTWTSLSPSVATVSATGLVSGVTDGQAIIRATSEGVSGQATITVFGSPVIATVTVTPASPLRGTGQTAQMTATARAGSGTIIGDATFTWTSSNTAVATVSPTGLVTLVSRGTAIIQASAVEITGTITGSTTVTVIQSLTNGVPFAVPGLGSNEVFFAMITVPAGLPSFTVAISGPGPAGPGDGDIYLYDPLTALPTGFSGSGGSTPTFRCRPWLYGSNESCTINAPAAGSYIVAVHNYPGAGDLSGVTLLLTHP